MDSTTTITDPCLRVNHCGVTYREFSCMYPTYGKTYLPFELQHDPVILRDWMRANPWLPALAVALYGGLIVWGQAYFRKHPAWNCRRALAFWNLALSVFSAIGFLRTAPYLFHNLWNHSWRDNFCLDPETNVGSGSTGIWCVAFTLSKVPELLDTFFIVVHKKKLIFLHWYHHISVLLFTWHAYVNNAPTGIIFCVMNYAVHAIMYFYYFCMAVHWKPRWFQPVWITVAQISQMILGVFVTALSCYLLYVEKPEHCWLSAPINNAALIMYGSYLFLFVQFFVRRYWHTPTKPFSSSSSSSSSMNKVKSL